MAQRGKDEAGGREEERRGGEGERERIDLVYRNCCERITGSLSSKSRFELLNTSSLTSTALERRSYNSGSWALFWISIFYRPASEKCLVMFLMSLARTVVDAGAISSLLSHLLKRLQFRRR
jgi:hypothetical protein